MIFPAFLFRHRHRHIEVKQRNKGSHTLCQQFINELVTEDNGLLIDVAGAIVERKGEGREVRKDTGL
ncbi:hypothetical protein F385_1475 [Pantoea agglomerans 299R]|jgi:hypothetical protein|nr:hypothetical protein F385_1475 [Pantoea agglomerans 299R]